MNTEQASVSVNTRRVFFVKYVADVSYNETLARRADLRLDRIENDSPDALAEPILAAAQVYQVSSARDEIVPKYHARAELLRRTPNLLIVSTNGVGFDTVDVDACTAAGVLVVNQAGGNREAVAEHVLGMMLCLSKRIIETTQAMRRDPLFDRTAFMGHDVFGKTVGIVGLGNVGRRVAELCRGLLGMRVIAYDPYLSAQDMAARGAEKVELDRVMRESDFVSINCPLTAETRHMIGERQYALMRPHAFFITTARGHIHDEAALAAALAGKRIAGAGLDVWASEPPPRDHPLLAFDNVLISPHTAGVTREARRNMGKIAAEQVLAALDGGRPERMINPDVWPVYARRFERAFGFAPGRDR